MRHLCRWNGFFYRNINNKHQMSKKATDNIEYRNFNAQIFKKNKQILKRTSFYECATCKIKHAEFDIRSSEINWLSVHVSLCFVTGSPPFHWQFKLCVLPITWDRKTTLTMMIRLFLCICEIYTMHISFSKASKKSVLFKCIVL